MSLELTLFFPRNVVEGYIHTYIVMYFSLSLSLSFLSILPPFSFGVVLWELLTGKRPYDTLNLFVVAYGVGHGTLSLPIPDGCPQPLATLLNGKPLLCHFICH